MTSAQSGEVIDLAFSPDGTSLASASPDGAVIWSAESGRVLHRLQVPEGVARLAFSPDGSLLGTAGYDGIARLWFTGTGNRYHVYPGHTQPLTDLAFSNDGRLLATASEDADARLWSVQRGTLLAVLRGQSGHVAAVAFSADRRWVVTAGPISAVLWPVSTGRLLFYLRGHTKGPLTSASFSPDGHTVLTSSADGTVRTYDCAVCRTVNELVTLAEHRLARGR
jgi:WD40 repeat protein